MKWKGIKLVEPNFFYNQDDAWKERYLKRVRTYIESGKAGTIVQQLLLMVDNKVKHYQTDFLVHDTHSLEGYGGDILWGLRPCGTHLFYFGYNNYEEMNDYIEITPKLQEWYQAIRDQHPKAEWYVVNIQHETIKKVQGTKADMIMSAEQERLTKEKKQVG